MKSYLQFMLFQIALFKQGLVGHSGELYRFAKMHFLDQICIILAIAARTDIELWRDRTAL